MENQAMRLRLTNVELPLDYTGQNLRESASKYLNLPASAILAVIPVRRSLDARPRRPAPVFILTMDVDVHPVENWRPPSHAVIREPDGSVGSAPSPAGGSWDPAPTSGGVRMPGRRPVIVGMGPAGLMAATVLAEAGIPCILIEQGDPVEIRTGQAASFWRDGSLDPESNVLFGEGGAGLFSDGKLTSRSKERTRMHRFFSLLVELTSHAPKQFPGEALPAVPTATEVALPTDPPGSNPPGSNAPQNSAFPADPFSLLIDAEPHLGSDVMVSLLKEWRKRLEKAGVEILFRHRLEEIHSDHGRLVGLRLNQRFVATEHCILAPGHSSRDLYRHLAQTPGMLAEKPFAMGIRLEMAQAAIDRAQFGKFAGHPALGAASFRLTRRSAQGTAASYSFCMCPGGSVITCASEPGGLTTNGMSLAKRAGPFGNAAFLVPVDPEDYPMPADIPASLSGMEWQRTIERKAFNAAGAGYALPACRLYELLEDLTPASLPPERSVLSAHPVPFSSFLPARILQTLKVNLPLMLRELNGVNIREILAYGPETRSSSPIRITRDETGQSPAMHGLFPAGEGSGYAGGIVSSAVDGMKAAEAVLHTLGGQP